MPTPAVPTIAAITTVGELPEAASSASSCCNELVVLVEGRSKPVRVARRSGAPYERALLIVAGEHVAAARGQPGRP